MFHEWNFDKRVQISPAYIVDKYKVCMQCGTFFNTIYQSQHCVMCGHILNKVESEVKYVRNN